MTGNGPTTRLSHSTSTQAHGPSTQAGSSTQRSTATHGSSSWVHHRPGIEIPPAEPIEARGAYYEAPTRPLRIDAPTGRYAPAPRPTRRRRVDPPVVLAALVMIALAVGVIVGLATL